jgi:hypothetical protein
MCLKLGRLVPLDYRLSGVKASRCVWLSNFLVSSMYRGVLPLSRSIPGSWECEKRVFVRRAGLGLEDSDTQIIHDQILKK